MTVLEELIRNAQKHERLEDIAKPGCAVAVTLHQCHRMLTFQSARIERLEGALRTFANKDNWVHPEPDVWQWGFRKDINPEAYAQAWLEVKDDTP